MSARRKPRPKPKKERLPAHFYNETAAHTKKIVARITEKEAKHLRSIARRLECLVMDSGSSHPVPSTRALVQAIAAGKLVVSRKPIPAADPTPPSSPQGGCPKD